MGATGPSMRFALPEASFPVQRSRQIVVAGAGFRAQPRLSQAQGERVVAARRFGWRFIDDQGVVGSHVSIAACYLASHVVGRIKQAAAAVDCDHLQRQVGRVSESRIGYWLRCPSKTPRPFSPTSVNSAYTLTRDSRSLLLMAAILRKSDRRDSVVWWYSGPAKAASHAQPR